MNTGNLCTCELIANFPTVERVPTLYLNGEEREELAKLIILDPAWLGKVMSAVVELDPSDPDFRGDRKPAMKLTKAGIASKELLMEIWGDFLADTDDRNQSFGHLCTILKAYCLIYPLKESTVRSLEDHSSTSESSETQSVRHFLIPCMLRESTERRDDNHWNWIIFYFDFESFLPEELYHRLICQLIAEFQRTNSNRVTPTQVSKSLCRFNNINGCNWKVELLRDVHRLKISVL